jgi:glycerol uptake facilitator-like aquaporin
VNIQIHKKTELTDNQISGIGVMAAGYMMGRYISPYYLNPAICIFKLEFLYLFASLLGGAAAAYFYQRFYLEMVKNID